MREDVKQKHFATLSVRPRSVRASRPLLLRGEDLVLTPGAPQSTTGIRIAVAGLAGVVSCSGPDTIRCEAAQANRWLKCQSGRRRRVHTLASVRRSNCTCRFPAYSFHADAPERERAPSEGIRETRFTKPNSSYSFTLGSCIHPRVRQRRKRCD